MLTLNSNVIFGLSIGFAIYCLYVFYPWFVEITEAIFGPELPIENNKYENLYQLPKNPPKKKTMKPTNNFGVANSPNLKYKLIYRQKTIGSDTEVNSYDLFLFNDDKEKIHLDIHKNELVYNWITDQEGNNYFLYAVFDKKIMRDKIVSIKLDGNEKGKPWSEVPLGNNYVSALDIIPSPDGTKLLIPGLFSEDNFQNDILILGFTNGKLTKINEKINVNFYDAYWKDDEYIYVIADGKYENISQRYIQKLHHDKSVSIPIYATLKVNDLQAAMKFLPCRPVVSELILDEDLILA